MTDRDRLIRVIDGFVFGIEIAVNSVEWDSTKVKDLADHLLANGVIVLPCEKGAVLNRNGEKCIANHWNIILTAFNEDNHVRLFDIKEVEEKLKELKSK